MNIWVVSDGKAGDHVQCMGVAQRLGGTIVEKVVKPGRLSAISPRALLPMRDRPQNPQSPIAPPFPDVVISSGRRTLPYLKAIKDAAGDQVITVCLKDPRASTSVADIIWVSEHDKLRGENVVVTLTSPHPLHVDALERYRNLAATRFADFPEKRIGLILGGITRGVKWNAASCAEFTEILAKIPVAGHSILAIASRRTPPQLEAAVKSALSNHTLFYSNGTDNNDNPYREILAIADVLIATGDSHNMVSEALSTIAPVYVFRPKGLKPKLHQFLDELEKRKLIRKFTGTVEHFPTQQVNATDEIVNAIKKLL